MTTIIEGDHGTISAAAGMRRFWIAKLMTLAGLLMTMTNNNASWNKWNVAKAS
jgi:hypothetical protein